MPTPSPQKNATENKAVNTPGTLVLQWLTYAFWGWTILALWVLTAFSVGYFVDSANRDDSTGSGIAYPLAAVIVLFIISAICDILYSRREPVEKIGVASIVMIIHAVIFALFGIAAVIIAAFAIVTMLIGDNESAGVISTLITGLIIAAVYAVTMLRTLRLFKLKNASMLYIGFMVLVSVVVSLLGIFGPALYAQRTQTDKQIERGLGSVSRAIRDHTVTNNALPDSLNDIEGTLNGNAAEIVQKGLVEYQPGEKYQVPTRQSTTSSRTTSNDAYRYKLCVSYVGEKNMSDNDDISSRAVSTSPSTYRHKSGRVCYDLVTNYR